MTRPSWLKSRDLALLGGGVLTGFWLYGQLVEWLRLRAMSADYDRQVTQPQAVKAQRIAAMAPQSDYEAAVEGSLRMADASPRYVDLGEHRHDGTGWGRA